jgi:plasmid stabilization system protein ParE
LETVRYLLSALEDLDRLAECLRESDPAAATGTARLILDSIRVPADHPLIGRPAGPNRRELVIYRGRTGYLAQYRYEHTTDEVVVAAVRHQREADLE